MSEGNVVVVAYIDCCVLVVFILIWLRHEAKVGGLFSRLLQGEHRLLSHASTPDRCTDQKHTANT